MPKMKTNRLAHKKLKVGGSGKVKHARAGMRHNTGNKSAKRNRQLGANKVIDRTNKGAVARLLPYAGVK